MPEIQEQVEQFRQKFQPSPLTDMHGFDTFAKQYYALLRSFLEECCKKQCIACRDGDIPKIERRYGGSGAYTQFYVHEPAAWRNTPPRAKECSATNIRRHFTWLEK